MSCSLSPTVLCMWAVRQRGSVRKGWQHSTNVQEEAGSEPSTKQHLRKKEMVAPLVFIVDRASTLQEKVPRSSYM